MFQILRILFIFILLSIASQLSPDPLNAQGFRLPGDVLLVTKTADTRDGSCNFDCSLREAVDLANATTGVQTIRIPAGTYELTRLGSNEDLNDTGDLDFVEYTTLEGFAAGGTIIDGGLNDRIFDAQYDDITAGQLVITDLVLQNGLVDGDGGAIQLRGGAGMNLVGVICLNNTSTGSGGAIYYDALAGTLEIADSSFEGNAAGVDGGAIWGALGATESVGVSIQTTILDSNVAGRDGGAFWYAGGNILIDQAELRFNFAGRNGGAVAAEGAYGVSATVTVTDTWVTQNIAEQDGGGLYFVALGGMLDASTLSDNEATTGNGGGVYYGLGDGGPAVGTIEFNNTTISGNKAFLSGGGAWLAYGTGAFLHATVVNNTAGPGEAGGICNESAGQTAIELKSTIVAENGGGGDCSGTTDFASQGHNLISDDTCVDGTIPSDLINTIPLVEALADNKGPTPTHALMAGSPAIDAADPDNTTELDQRGLTRNGIPDIGAFEAAAGSGNCALLPHANPARSVALIMPALALLLLLRLLLLGRPPEKAKRL